MYLKVKIELNKNTKKMRFKIIYVSLIFFCLAGALKSQNITMNITQLEIISLDSLALKKYNWIKCVVNKNDTIIVLSDKRNVLNCIKKQMIKLKKINSINDDIGYRFYFNDVYIDDILYFSKETEVYLLDCLSD